jgi:hypothetical protein
MGAASSNLSSMGYDFVCAVTQDVINSQLLPYVRKLHVPAFSGCFVIRGGATVAVPIADIAASIGGRDPFTLTDADPPWALVQSGFQFAFKMTPGVPPGLPRSQRPNPVELDQGPSSIRHQLCFTEFQVICLARVAIPFAPEMAVVWLNFTQDTANPVIISSRVDLGIGDSDLSALPADLQARLGTLYPGAMFSVKQLFLDLSRSSAIGCLPKIIATQFNPQILDYIVSEYWKQIPPKAALFPLGYGVTLPAADPTSSITPTALDFVVSPYLGTDGVSGLNTLNYLVMTNNHAMPPVAPFSWSWVDAKKDEQSFHAVMSIRSGIFADFLRNRLNTAAAPLSLVFAVTKVAFFGGINSAIVAPTFSTSTSPAQWQDGAGKILLTISGGGNFSGNVQFLGSALPPANYQIVNGEVYIQYLMRGSVTVSGPNTLSVSVGVQAWVSLTWDGTDVQEGGVNSLKIADYTQQAQYALAIGPSGDLRAEMTTNLVDNSQNPDSNWIFGDFLTSFRQALQTAVGNAVAGLDAEMEALLKGPGGWVFPGGQTFTFHDVVLCDSGDVVVHTHYLEPH